MAVWYASRVIRFSPRRALVVSLRRSWFLSQTREWVNLWVGLHSVNRTIGIVGIYGVCVLGCAREDSVEGALPIVAACTQEGRGEVREGPCRASAGSAFRPRLARVGRISKLTFPLAKNRTRKVATTWLPSGPREVRTEPVR